MVEVLPDGVEHRTGNWIGNTKARRDRLHPAPLTALAELGFLPFGGQANVGV
ncbi:hypothetical protein [Streptomyces sp. Isolate_45]|uniref:hypothetical protein n=1 Tax=Streptomyces sp. Isolate_45 TaxID=2950111 RepID=UPI002481F29F|nr:hypothetical protein [Streptomyces sp. Isolate_45]MDA5279562.1 hypothetical protein [Streptomyces sp. Isolate_45]